jgi:glycosyltransferase involved in cell wall biosynthesis
MFGDMAKLKPILILSDAPSCSSGLGRACRDVATGITQKVGDVYRVATFGYGGPGSVHLPFFQYHIEDMNNWVTPTLPKVWEDWSQGEDGILLTIWDPSRVGWLAQPEHDENLAGFDDLRAFLLSKPFQKWIYAPVDATGPWEKLDISQRHTLLGFDRIIAYGQFGAQTILNTIDAENALSRHLAFIPHGIDSSVFHERNRNTARFAFLGTTKAKPIRGQADPVAKDELLVGIVATNQRRKDWALGIEAVGLLAQNHKVRLWIHTNTLENEWSIPALLYNFNMLDRTVISLGYLSDDKMAKAYSACDVTLGIGAGEGFGYPIMESLFCGTPCIHGNYAGAPEWMKVDDLLIDPVAFHIEGVYSCKRPVFSAASWASKILTVAGLRMNRNGEIDLKNVWGQWNAYLREAAK